MLACDGLVVGSPVHYASAGGSITSFLDRMFYAGGSQLRTKVGAAVVSARRAGTTSTLDQLNKYFTICGMPMKSFALARENGLLPPDMEKPKKRTNFIR